MALVNSCKSAARKCLSGHLQLHSKVSRMSTIYDFTATTLEGDDVSMAKYRGRVVLVVNTATL